MPIRGDNTMTLRTAVTAALLLAATALPALAENYANDPARPYARVEQEAALGASAAAPGAPTRQEATNRVAPATLADAGAGSSLPWPAAGATAFAPGRSIPAGG
jgi:hypothetical protein